MPSNEEQVYCPYCHMPTRFLYDPAKIVWEEEEAETTDECDQCGKIFVVRLSEVWSYQVEHVRKRTKKEARNAQ